MRLQDAGSRFRSKYYTLTGRELFGEILAPPTGVGGKADYTNPRRILKVSNKTIISPGEVILDNGRRYLCVDYADISDVRTDHKLLRLYEASQTATITRKATIVDPLTGLTKTTSYTEVGASNIPCQLEYVGTTEDMRVTIYKYRIIIGVEIQPDDRINGKYTVVSASSSLGVYFGEVRT